MAFSFDKLMTGLASGLASNNGPIGGFGQGFMGASNAIQAEKEKEAVGKIMSGDNSGWADWGKVNPQAAINAWGRQQAIDQKNLEKQFNTTNERKNAEYLMSQGRTPEEAINIAFKINQNPSQSLTPAEKTLQVEQAKNIAEVQQKANALESSLPAFEEMAKQLNEVGKDVTYTKPGQAYDWTIRQLGLGATKGANARERYRQIVNNELLPKLRETFGGQLSDAERESLLSTLGNVDLSAPEREEAVKSFIESKKRQLEGYKRQLGQEKIETKEEVIDWRDL